MSQVNLVQHAGKIRVLLVTSEYPLKLAPGVPTMKEKGFKFSQISYMSIVAPAGTPQAALDKLSAAFKVATADKGVLKSCGKLDLHPKFLPGKKYQAMLEKLSAEWGALLPALGVKVKK